MCVMAARSLGELSSSELGACRRVVARAGANVTMMPAMAPWDRSGCNGIAGLTDGKQRYKSTTSPSEAHIARFASPCPVWEVKTTMRI